MTASSFGSPGEVSRLSCRMRLLSLILFVALFVAACVGVGTMIKYWS